MEKDDFEPFRSKEKYNPEFDKMYITYKKEFMSYVQKRFTVDKMVIEDIYQDSIIALWQEINSGKITSENRKASVKTYLFKRGLSRLYNYFRDKDKSVEILERIKYEMKILYYMNPLIDEATRARVQKQVMDLKEPCNQILLLHYYEHKTMDEIAEIVGYKNKDVAKNKRRWCLELLLKKINQRNNNKGFLS